MGAALDLNWFAIILSAICLSLLTFIAKSILFTITHLVIAITMVATFHLALYGIFGDIGLNPVVYAQLVFAVALSVSWLTRRYRVYDQIRIVPIWQEAILLISSSLLLLRWPLDRIGQYITLLRPEDNSRWISFAAELLPFRQGAIHPSAAVGGGAGGGHVYDYYIALIHVLTNLKSNLRLQDVTTAYITIGNTYKITILVILFLSSLLFLTLIKRIVTEKFSLIGAISVPIFMYPALHDVLLRTGHLSLLVTLLYLLVGTVFALAAQQKEDRYFAISILVAVVGLGAGGIWWPILPVSVVVIAYVLLSIFFEKKLFKNLVALVGSLLLLIVLYRTMSVYFVQYFRVISIRSFFSAQGGIQETPSLALGLGLFSICFLAIRITVKKGEFLRIPLAFVATFGLATYALILFVASYFIAPSFGPNYSVKKILFLLFLFTIPFLYTGMNISIAKVNPKIGLLFSPIIAISMALNLYGLDLNSPRNLVDQSWGPGLISIVQQDRNAVVLCSSNADNSYEAYVCTRQAKYLLGTGRWLSTAWHDYILTPQVGAIEKTMDEIYREFRRESPDSKIYVLSLESSFSFATANSWWMKPLPWREITVVNGATGELIPFLNIDE